MFIKRLQFLFLFLLAFCSFGEGALAQSVQQQFVVTYVEFKPGDTKAGAQMLDELAAKAEHSSGVVNFDVLQQIDSPNSFALFETWTTAQAFADFQRSSATRSTLSQLTHLLEAPLDERLGNLHAGTVTTRSQPAEDSQIFVITDVEIDPQLVGQIGPLLDTFVNKSLHDSGVQTFALLSHTPTPNYFQLVETFADLQAFDAHVSAQHTLEFRNRTSGLLGPPYAERLYQFVDGGTVNIAEKAADIVIGNVPAEVKSRAWQES
ncbi:MAG TPA: antibiotic biosynthesis monooxygenase [Candidatus Deferrimicrobiaceae bacterium]|nr:antibiotic biosynthesis monooxygenase [Candidatus Deferrimicrobiaceae bacterium]